MSVIDKEFEALRARRQWGSTVVCPRCLTGAMAVVERDDFEVALMCLACGHERVSERTLQTDRKLMEDVERAQADWYREIGLQMNLMAGRNMVKVDMCRALGVSRSTLDRMIERHPIEGGMIVNEQPNRWRFPYEAAERWLVERQAEISVERGRAARDGMR